jgi:5-methylcytosine-specific restriction protein A
MPYPPYDQLEMPLLKLIYEQGGPNHELHATATYKPLSDHFGLSEVERTQSRAAALNDGRDEPFWNNMIQWARRKLNEKGYLAEAPRGYWRLSDLGISKAKPLATGQINHVVYPDEIPQATIEGAKRPVLVNAYERSSIARQKCIDHHGYACAACGIDLEQVYGVRGKNLIHVHHIVPLASIGESYEVDPINDLRPICPNCHAIIHRTTPPCTIEELKHFIEAET